MNDQRSTINDDRVAAVSLEEVHATVPIPLAPSFFRRFFAFSGPAYLVSVGYMDPGNWATDLEGGARFNYSLIWVILMSNMMAILLQSLCARLGVVAGRDLAQACRENYPRPVGVVLWILCEIAIAACDLAEVLGTAIALNLLFHIPLLLGVFVTAVDALLILLLQNFGIRKMESLILALVSIIAACFVIEIALCKPDWVGVAHGFVPRLEPGALYVAMGILGATVMPHNLYLHSALVQSRQVEPTSQGRRIANRFNLIDSTLALNAAFFVNAAILIVAASTFYRYGRVVTEIQQAHELFRPLLGTALAPLAFAIALLCSGQSSTLTGTLAGQVVMEGFVQLRMKPWQRRLLTRSIAIIPAAATIAVMGAQGTYRLLILSQVILSLQLSFAIVPLIHFTSSRKIMGEFASGLVLKLLAWGTAAIIISLNGRLVAESLMEWIRNAGSYAIALYLTAVPIALALAALLAWMIFQPWAAAAPRWTAWASLTVARAKGLSRRLFAWRGELLMKDLQPVEYRRIGVALERQPTDRKILAHAVSLARHHGAEVVLIHAVETPAAAVYGPDAYDAHTREDEMYIEGIRRELQAMDIPCRWRLVYGSPAARIPAAVEEEGMDLLVMGSHGHRFLADLIHGHTVDPVRHAISVPVLVIRVSEP